MITKVISGGQTGADIAGLRAAKACGLATGGYMTKGCRTLDGPKPEYIYEFDMIELPYSGYKDRTYANVWVADATIRLATNWKSRGELCTLGAIRKFSKPYMDIPIHSTEYANREFGERLIQLTALHIDRQGWEIINIAGNSEKTSPGIEKKVESFLYMVFHCLVAA
jgi:hypothetical protein